MELPRNYREISKKEFLDMARETCDKALEILGAKNDDYSTRDLQGDGLHNFRLIETYKLATAETGVFVRLSDKMTRIANFLNTGILSVQDEKIEDTICDAMNYLIILKAIIKSYKGGSDAT